MFELSFDVSTESAINDYDLYDIGQEGFLTTTSVEENLDLLSGKDKSLVIITSDNALPYGGISKKYILQIMNKYQFKDFDTIDVMEYLMMRLNESNVSTLKKFDIKCSSGDLLSQLNKVKFNNNDFISTTYEKFFNVVDAYVATSNKLIIVINGYVRSYVYSIMRNRPMIITDASLVSTFFKKLMSSKSLFDSINYTKSRDITFEVMNDKIPSNMIMFGKDLSYPLFHISPIGNISQLEPRITSKPMNRENIKIARISAAPTVDACFKAIGLKIDNPKEKKRYYVYKLKIGPQIRIVKPTTKLVPDVYNTHEHWVLDPVPVENYGYIDVSLDDKKGKYIFNDKNVRIDPMINTVFYKHN